jgi:glutathione synthase
MKLAFIVDPLDGFKIYKDTSFAMMREAAARGCELYTLQQEDIFWRKHRVAGNAQRLTLTGNEYPWYRSDAAVETDLAAFDAVIMRKDPPFDTEYFYSTYLLETAEAHGARVFNRPQAIRDHSEKLSIARYARFITSTVVTRLESVLREFLAEHGDVILKPLDGMGGASVFRVRHDDPNVGVIIETLTQLGTRTIMAQRYLPEIVDGDKRVLLIGGKPVPFCLARIPKAGETRGNLAAGGTGVARELTPRDREIAEALAPVLYAQGLLLVGLDVIGSCLTEINVTSPTCFQEITQQTGCNVAGLFMDALAESIKNK